MMIEFRSYLVLTRSYWSGTCHRTGRTGPLGWTCLAEFDGVVEALLGD